MELLHSQVTTSTKLERQRFLECLFPKPPNASVRKQRKSRRTVAVGFIGDNRLPFPRQNTRYIRKSLALGVHSNPMTFIKRSQLGRGG